MEFHEFNRLYKDARAELLAGDRGGVGAVQQRLRSLVAGLADDSDQKIAVGLIEGLPELLAQARPASSPEMAEALRILDQADFETGTVEQRRAAIDAARQKIWAIADRAGADSGAVRGLTRGLESVDRDLAEGLPWTDSPGGTARA